MPSPPGEGGPGGGPDRPGTGPTDGPALPLEAAVQPGGPGSPTGPATPTRWVRRDDVLWASVGSAVALLVPERRDPLVVTGSAAPLWAQLAEPRTLAELAAGVAEHVDAAVEEVASALPDLLRALEDVGAVRGATAAPRG